MTRPAKPKVYHITHVANLSGIINEGLLSDALMVARSRDFRNVGMRNIKRRRLNECQVQCHPGTLVGEYVPFYFCPRSVMLYILHKGNHLEIDYTAGQEPLVHLEFDYFSLCEWADREQRPWAFSDTNASAHYANFYYSHDDLQELDWAAISANEWGNRSVKEKKQAEYLVYQHVPWDLVNRIGTLNNRVVRQVNSILVDAAYRPAIAAQPTWYY